MDGVGWYWLIYTRHIIHAFMYKYTCLTSWPGRFRWRMQSGITPTPSLWFSPQRRDWPSVMKYWSVAPVFFRDVKHCRRELWIQNNNTEAPQSTLGEPVCYSTHYTLYYKRPSSTSLHWTVTEHFILRPCNLVLHKCIIQCEFSTEKRLQNCFYILSVVVLTNNKTTAIQCNCSFPWAHEY